MLPELFYFSCRDKTSHIEFIVDYRNLASKLIAVVKENQLTAYLFKLRFFIFLYDRKLFLYILQLYFQFLKLSVKLCGGCFSVAVKEVR